MKLLWIAAGGAVGSAARYLLETGCQRWSATWFPTGTLAVNALGSFALGFAMVVLEVRGALDSTLRLGLVTGLLGGFTTYSSFNHQTLELLRARGWLAAGGNVLATVLGCLAAGGLGLGAARWLARP
jgi:CrcB protein